MVTAEARVSSTASRSAAASSPAAVPDRGEPALVTTTSSRPRSAATPSTHRRSASQSRTSSAAPDARPGPAPASSPATAAASRSGSRPQTETTAPSAASAVATASPSPLLPAATSATRSVRPRSMLLLRPASGGWAQQGYGVLVGRLRGGPAPGVRQRAEHQRDRPGQEQLGERQHHGHRAERDHGAPPGGRVPRQQPHRGAEPGQGDRQEAG